MQCRSHNEESDLVLGAIDRDNTTMLAPLPCRPGPNCPVASRPAPQARSAEERKRRGSTAQPGHRTDVRGSARRRHDDDEAVTARMAPFIERYYVSTGNSVFVCKTNVGQYQVNIG
jgi:hypothetical protein